MLAPREGAVPGIRVPGHVFEQRGVVISKFFVEPLQYESDECKQTTLDALSTGLCFEGLPYSEPILCRLKQYVKNLTIDIDVGSARSAYNVYKILSGDDATAASNA